MNKVLRIFLYIIPFTIPIFSLGIEIGDYLSSVVFIFTILAGFFLAAATSNYLRLQSLIAQEDALLVAIIRLVKKINPSSFKSVADKIDEYMIAVLDYDLLDYAAGTKTEFNSMLDAIDSVSPKIKENASLFQNLHDAKNTVIQLNSESLLTTKSVVSPFHWVVITGFAFLTSTLILSLRSDNWVSISISGLLIVGIFEVLELIHAIDSGSFLAAKIAYESPQAIFQNIGKLNYYSEIAVKSGWVKNLPSEYRLGVYKNFPKTFDKEIKTVKEGKVAVRSK